MRPQNQETQKKNCLCLQGPGSQYMNLGACVFRSYTLNKPVASGVDLGPWVVVVIVSVKPRYLPSFTVGAEVPAQVSPKKQVAVRLPEWEGLWEICRSTWNCLS